MRIVVALIVVLPLLLAAAAARPAAPAARACSPAPPDLREFARRADVIALVEVIEPGTSGNPLPTLPPQPTFTPWPTDTPWPPVTPSPTGTPVWPPSPSATPEPAPVRTAISLAGIGARVRVLEAYAGAPADELTLDAATRAALEGQARKLEALPPHWIPPCPFGLTTTRFVAGARYLVFTNGDGSEVFWAAEATGEPGSEVIESYFVLPRALHEAFLPGEDAGEDYTIDGAVFLIRDGGLPLPLVVAMARVLRGEAEIRPPNTGSAGLKPQASP